MWWKGLSSVRGREWLCIVRYRRPFELTVNDNVFMAEMGRLGWGADGGGWSWRRRLFVWEEEKVDKCCFFEDNIFYRIM